MTNRDDLEYGHGEFLEVRAGYIRRLRREGFSWDWIAQVTGTDLVQAQLIALSGPVDHGLRKRLAVDAEKRGALKGRILEAESRPCEADCLVGRPCSNCRRIAQLRAESEAADG